LVSWLLPSKVCWSVESVTGCGNTILTQHNFDGLQVWDKPGLSGYLVDLVHLVSFVQPKKPDKPNKPNEQDGLADFVRHG
jgi:hypothetical protein